MTRTTLARRPMVSPCVQICVIDSASGLCEGCGRTLDEIGGWMAMTDAERSAVMAELPRRLAKRKGGA